MKTRKEKKREEKGVVHFGNPAARLVYIHIDWHKGGNCYRYRGGLNVAWPRLERYFDLFLVCFLRTLFEKWNGGDVNKQGCASIEIAPCLCQFLFPSLCERRCFRWRQDWKSTHFLVCGSFLSWDVPLFPPRFVFFYDENYFKKHNKSWVKKQGNEDELECLHQNRVGAELYFFILHIALLCLHPKT